MNNKNYNYFLILFLFSISLFFGCKKDAGIGGKKTLGGVVSFYNGVSQAYEPAPNAFVYIAYGTAALTNNYNQTVVTDSNGKFKLEGLLKGDYFITAEYTDIHGFKYTTNGYSVTIKNKKSELIININLQ